jgi:enoyl-[acyl-carrier protein] reductase I
VSRLSRPFRPGPEDAAVRKIDLAGKTALVLGVANQRSLAWGIAEALGDAGCRLAFTYQGERLQENVTELASKYRRAPVMALDVTSDEQMDGVFAKLKSTFGHLDYLIHSIAFAPKEELRGDFIDTSRNGWRTAMDISAYSLVTLSRRAVPLMPREGGSIVALTFQASRRVFPRYNVMGSAKAALEHIVRQLAFELGERQIRVNAISAGPVPTLAARGITGFTGMASHHRARSPLRRNVSQREVGDTALYLCSEMASGVTGTTLYVDAGFHIMGS